MIDCAPNSCVLKAALTAMRAVILNIDSLLQMWLQIYLAVKIIIIIRCFIMPLLNPLLRSLSNQLIQASVSQEAARLLHVPHLHPNMSHSHDVMDLLLDQTRGQQQNIMMVSSKRRNFLWIMLSLTVMMKLLLLLLLMTSLLTPLLPKFSDCDSLCRQFQPGWLLGWQVYSHFPHRSTNAMKEGQYFWLAAYNLRVSPRP